MARFCITVRTETYDLDLPERPDTQTVKQLEEIARRFDLGDPRTGCYRVVEAVVGDLTQDRFGGITVGADRYDEVVQALQLEGHSVGFCGGDGTERFSLVDQLAKSVSFTPKENESES